MTAEFASSAFTYIKVSIEKNDSSMYLTLCIQEQRERTAERLSTIEIKRFTFILRAFQSREMYDFASFVSQRATYTAFAAAPVTVPVRTDREHITGNAENTAVLPTVTDAAIS